MIQEQKKITQTEAVVVKKCRVCGNPSLVSCIDLGDQYLSSVFPENLNYRSLLRKFPLKLVICDKKAVSHACGLVQLAHQLDLSPMYESYPYTSATNSSMRTVLKDVADNALALKHLTRGDLILDIGGNDGTLLSFFQDAGVDMLCIDAAKNVNPVFESKQFMHVRDFFTKKLFASVSNKKAKLIFSIAMFYHLDNPVTFSRHVAECLDPDGAWIIQMAYLPTMLKTVMYDNIVHEHNGYYGLYHLKWIMEKVGLEIFDVTLNNVYGGSFRVFVKNKNCVNFPSTDRVQKILQEEEKIGMFDETVYRSFVRKMEQSRSDLLKLCDRIKKEFKIIWAYGASTKGNTILQYSGLSANELTAVADTNPFKLGKYMIGSDVPIKDEAAMRRAKPDYLLALPYSFTGGFIKRESDLIRAGTRFIVPLPHVELKPAP